MPKLFVPKSPRRKAAEVVLHAALAFSLTVIGGLAATAMVSTHRKIAVVDTWRYDFRWILVAAAAVMVAWICLVILALLKEEDKRALQRDPATPDYEQTMVLPRVDPIRGNKPGATEAFKSSFGWPRRNKAPKPDPAASPAALPPTPDAATPEPVHPDAAEKQTARITGEDRRAMPDSPGARRGGTNN